MQAAWSANEPVGNLRRLDQMDFASTTQIRKNEMDLLILILLVLVMSVVVSALAAAAVLLWMWWPTRNKQTRGPIYCDDDQSDIDN